MIFKLTSIFTAIILAAPMLLALPTPPEVWQDYDPDAGAFKEEIIKEETKDGIHSRDSYISAYVLGEEVKPFALYMAPLTSDEREILADGCLINYYKH